MERRFRRDLSSLQDVFQFVSEFLSAHGLDASNAHDLELILEELFTNVLKYRKDGAETVAVRLERNGETITLSFQEFDVDAFDITKLPEPDLERPASERPIGGLGIHLIRKLAESVGYEYKDRVSTTTVTKKVGDDV